MPSVYLQPSDYGDYGLPTATSKTEVIAASVLIDAYLQRSEGLVWTPDADGNPGWMAAQDPQIALAAQGSVSPGRNVQVAVTGGIQAIAIGDALVFDRTGSAEIVVVGSKTVNPATITLVSVGRSHGIGASLEQGLVLKQHKFMPEGRPLTMLAYTPVARLLSGQGRYGYGRRGSASRYAVDDYNLLASLSQFGGPPAWEAFPLENTGIDAATGQVWVPAGVMLAYYSEVNIWYVAGFPANGLPAVIKSVCASLVRNARNQLPFGDVKSYKSGDTQIQLAASSLLSADAKQQLAPYRARLLG